MSTNTTEQNTSHEIEEYFEKQLERTNSWLSFAEAKNAGLIAVNIALMAVIIELFSDAPVFCVIAVAFAIASSIVCLISFDPNMGKAVDKVRRKNKSKDLNLTFYGDIAQFDSTEQYINKTKELYFDKKDNVSRQAHDLAAEVLINSQITVRKYNWFKIALKIDFAALAFAMILFIAA